jgi:hypothetical protein
MSTLKFLQRSLKTASRDRGARRPWKSRIQLEDLEGRISPSILFTPQQGAENPSHGGGQLLGQSAPGVPIYTIFWGSYWATTEGKGYAKRIEDSLNPIFNWSPYLDGLHQYNISYRAGVGTSGTVEVPNDSDPSSLGFSMSDLQSIVRNAINNQGLPGPNTYSNEGMYVVFTQYPSFCKEHPNTYAFHTNDSGNIVEAWISGFGGIDKVTTRLSHEVVESITDPNGDGWQVEPRSPDKWNEVADNEAQNYTYRLNGYQVQSYWNPANGAFMVPDGNTQNFCLDPIWNGATFSGKYTLRVQGDQLSVPYNDNIAIDTTNSGGASVTLNGEIASFDPGQISSIIVSTQGGSNTVNVYNTNVPVTIHGGGTDTVNIGNTLIGGQGITADVTVDNPPSYTTLNIDDSDNTGGCTAAVTFGKVSGLTKGTIYYNQNDLGALNITGGSDANTFTVTSTPNNNHGVTTTLLSGSGNHNIVNVEGTNGPLTVDGGYGTQSVYVGSNGSSFNGTLANVSGSVQVENSTSFGTTSLYVDDSADRTGQTWNLNYDQITTGIPGMGSINWSNYGLGSGGVGSLQVRGGAGLNTLNVYSTGSIIGGVYYSYATNVYTGTGGANVNITSTLGSLNVINQAGHDQVVIGNNATTYTNGTVANIQGSVDVYGNGDTYLRIDDSGDTNSQTNVSMYDGELTGLAPASIYWSASSTAAGGVTSLVIYGSGGGSTYTVNDTGNFYNNTFLETGGGNDTVNVLATTGPLYVFNSGGQDSTYVGTSSGAWGNGTAASINGLVDVYGLGSTWLFVDDSHDSNGHNNVAMTDGSLTGLSNGAIDWSASSTPTGGVTSLGVYGSGGGSTYTVYNTSAFYSYTVLETGPSNDVVNVLETTGALLDDNSGGSDSTYVGTTSAAFHTGQGTTAGIRGPVNVNGAGSTYLYVDDSADARGGHTVGLDDGSLTGLSPGYIAWWPSSNATGGLTYLDVIGSGGGSTYTVYNTSTFYLFSLLETGPGNDVVNVLATTGALFDDNTGGSDTVTVGTGKMSSINGIVEVYGAAGSSTGLKVDDSGDGTSHTVTLTSSYLDGLGDGGQIYYNPNVTALTVLGPLAGSTFNIESTAAGTATTVNGGAGSDTFNISSTANIGSTAENLNSIQGNLSIFGFGGTNALVLDDQANAANNTCSLTSSTMTRTGVATISYASVSSLVLNGGSGTDTYNVNGTAAGLHLALNAGKGNDTFHVNATTASSSVSVNCGTGNDTLAGPNVASTWNITGANAGTVGNVTFSGVENLTGGTASDTFKFGAGKGVTGRIDGGAGTDTLDYSAYLTGVTVNLTTGAATGTGGIANVENVIGSPVNDRITGNGLNNVISGNGGNDVLNGGGGGADTFYLAPTQGAGTTVTGAGFADTLVGVNITNTWSITGSNSGKVNGIAFTGIANLTGGTANDTFKFASAGSMSGKIDGGAGVNTLDYSGDGGVAATVNLATNTATKTGGFAHIQKLIGSSSAADKLIGPNATNIWSITAVNGGTVGSFSFSAVENLTGGSGLDLFVFSAGKTVSGKIDGGGGGNDWLDYAAYTTPVTVNLATNTATGVGGGIAHIPNVRGGQGGNTLTGNALGNILIGGAGPNTINGGTGRSLLIGGKGKDTVTGHSGGDLLIAGSTDYDASSLAHDLALESLLAEWQSANSYATRIHNLKYGGGLNGSNKLIWGYTVHDNATANANKLTGGGGASGQNWFLANLTHTTTNKMPQEQLN